jgi:hypothetical protein
MELEVITAIPSSVAPDHHESFDSGDEAGSPLVCEDSHFPPDSSPDHLKFVDFIPLKKDQLKNVFQFHSPEVVRSANATKDARSADETEVTAYADETKVFGLDGAAGSCVRSCLDASEARAAGSSRTAGLALKAGPVNAAGSGDSARVASRQVRKPKRMKCLNCDEKGHSNRESPNPEKIENATKKAQFDWFNKGMLLMHRQMRSDSSWGWRTFFCVTSQSCEEEEKKKP